MTIHAIGAVGFPLPITGTTMEDLVRALQERRSVDAFLGDIFVAEWHYYIKAHPSPLAVALVNGQFASFIKILASLEEKKILKEILNLEKFDDEDVRGYRSLSEGFLPVEGPLFSYFAEMVAKRLVAAALVPPSAFVQPPFCVAVTNKESATCFFSSFHLLDRTALNERIKDILLQTLDILLQTLIFRVYQTPAISVRGEGDRVRIAEEMLVGVSPTFEMTRSLELLRDDDPSNAILAAQLVRKPEAFRKMVLAARAWGHRREAVAVWAARAAATSRLAAHASP